MNRSLLSSPVLGVVLVVAATSCGTTVVLEEGNGTGGGSSSGTGAGATTSSSGTSSSTGSASSGTSSSGTIGSSGSTSSSGSNGGPPPLQIPCGGQGTIGWIDTMNNGEGRIDPTDGRKGSWYTFNDMTAGGMQTPAAQSPFTMTPIPGNAPAPLPGSTLAANTFGGAFDTWGAAMAFDLNNDGITYASYDASMFQGFCLWARVGPEADAGGATIRLRFLDANTTPQGGVCDGSATTGPNQCYDGFGADLQLTQTWQSFRLPWGALKQQGWGQAATAIAANALYSVDFDSGAADAFDTWVLGVSFY